MNIITDIKISGFLVHLFVDLKLVPFQICAGFERLWHSLHPISPPLPHSILLNIQSETCAS